MKKVSFISTLLFTILLNIGLVNGQTQPISTKNGTIFYEGVITATGNVTKQDLFRKTKQWIASYHPSTPTYSPIQLEDEENGILIIQINLDKIQCDKCNYSYENITFSGKLQFKNGKYKYTFTHFKTILNLTSEGKMYRSDTNFDDFIKKEKLYKTDLEVLNNLDNQIKEIINNLIQTLKEPVLDDF